MQSSKEKASVDGKPLNTRQQSRTLAAAAAKRSKNENKITNRITDQRRDKLLELRRKVKKKKESSKQKKKKGPCATTNMAAAFWLHAPTNARNVTQSGHKKAIIIIINTNRTYLCRRSWKSNVAFPSRNNDTRLGQKKTGADPMCLLLLLLLLGRPLRCHLCFFFFFFFFFFLFPLFCNALPGQHTHTGQ